MATPSQRQPSKLNAAAAWQDSAKVSSFERMQDEITSQEQILKFENKGERIG